MDKKKLNVLFGGIKKITTIITSVQDTHLRTTASTTNYNGANPFIVRMSVYNAIIKFDLSPLPATSTIISAKLKLNCVTTQTATISVYPILAANADMVFAQMTYDIKKTGTAWAGDTGGDGGVDAGCNVVGTDYDGTAVGSVILSAATPVPYIVEIDILPATIQSQLTNNYGFLIKSNYDGGSTSFSSAEGVITPTLTVVYK